MRTLEIIQRYGPEMLGAFGLIGIIVFAVTYARHAAWRITPEGRSVMYLALCLILTIVLLVAHGFTGGYAARWVVELVCYSPLVWACWNLAYTLRRSLGLKPTFLFIIARKPRSKEKKP